MSDDTVLYLFVNTNLASMNYGKALAQASHVSNAFIEEYYIKKSILPKDIEESVKEWKDSTGQGFGTVYAMKAKNWSDITDTVDGLFTWGAFNGYPCNLVEDPTYPFEVSEEVFDLMKDEYKEGAIKKEGGYLCFRSENTGFYIFGRKSDPKLKQALRKFKLHD